MANNTAIANATVGSGIDGVNITQDGSKPPSRGAFGGLEFLLISTQVMLSAMFIIWLGSHASLRRPPSAAAPKKSRGKKREKEEKFAEGLVASDAIMFPVIAGIVLVGLYYLIQWLQDPQILNKILRTYTSVMSFACLGKLCADFISFLTTLLFPSKWATSRGTLYNVDAEERKQYEIDPVTGSRIVSQDKRSPLPSPIGDVLSDKVNSFLWEIRHLLTEQWKVRLAMHGIGSAKTKITLDTILGTFLAVLLIIGYYLTNSVALSNLLGAAFSYSAFTVMSPTSFNIGTMVLFGLFFYDIIMVFYT
jgi:minor histocompatibility antigen H13